MVRLNFIDLCEMHSNAGIPHAWIFARYLAAASCIIHPARGATDFCSRCGDPPRWGIAGRIYTCPVCSHPRSCSLEHVTDMALYATDRALLGKLMGATGKAACLALASYLLDITAKEYGARGFEVSFDFSVWPY